jgi:phospholipid/cholesterol/gamma-HCH transport system substrate-binding protein
MNERKNEITVGVVVVTAVLLLSLGIAWGKKTDLFLKRKRLAARFESVRGLENGDPVTVRGIHQGEVERLELQPDGVTVSFWIKKNTPVFADARVAVGDRDLMGGKQVFLDPGRGPEPLAAGSVLAGTVQFDMQEIVLTGGNLIARIDSLMIRVRSLSDPDRLNRMLQQAEGATGAARTLLQENRQAIHATVNQLETITQTLRNDSTAARLGHAIVRLDSTLSVVQRVAKTAETGDGTLKRLIQDPKLYERLLETSRNLDSLIADIKRNPRRYIHVSVF